MARIPRLSLTALPLFRRRAFSRVPENSSRVGPGLLAVLCLLSAPMPGSGAQTASGRAPSGQPASVVPSRVAAIIAPAILMPAESATVDLPVQVGFELPGGASAVTYAAEIAY